MPWPWNRARSTPITAALPKPAELPKLKLGQKRCRFCHYGIVRMRGLSTTWWTPIGGPHAPGVALPSECPGQLLEAGTRRYGHHEPA